MTDVCWPRTSSSSANPDTKENPSCPPQRRAPASAGAPRTNGSCSAGLATALLAHDRITTTEAKAKRLRPLAERLVTFAKRGDLHARRRVLTVVRDKGVVHRLFTEIAPDMAQRPGGYTRITKIGARKGDNAPMAVIELVREPLSAKQATVKEAEAATQRAARAPVTPTDLPAPAADLRARGHRDRRHRRSSARTFRLLASRMLSLRMPTLRMPTSRMPRRATPRWQRTSVPTTPSPGQPTVSVSGFDYRMSRTRMGRSSSVHARSAVRTSAGVIRVVRARQHRSPSESD